MKTNLRLFAGVLAAFAAMSLAPVRTLAAGLTTGHYHFEVTYSPICLDGKYPVNMAGFDVGTLDLNTKTTGALRGTAELSGNDGPLKGFVTTRRDYVAVLIKITRGTHTGMIGGRLAGQTIKGKIKRAGDDVICKLDVSSVAPLVVTFDLDLTVNAQGVVSGRGTAKGCRQEMELTATGTSKRKQCTLTLQGPKRFLFESSGVPKESGFNAKWKGRGFGAIVRGRNLLIAPE